MGGVGTSGVAWDCEAGRQQLALIDLKISQPRSSVDRVKSSLFAASSNPPISSSHVTPLPLISRPSCLRSRCPYQYISTCPWHGIGLLRLSIILQSADINKTDA